MAGIHICLNLEYETGKCRAVHGNDRAFALARKRRFGVGEKAVQQKLHAEVVPRAAEEDRRQKPALHRCGIEAHSGRVQHLDLLQQPAMIPLRQPLADGGSRQRGDGHWRAVCPSGDELEEMHLPCQPVVHAAEFEPGSEGPIHRISADAEDLFEFIKKRDRVLRRPVEFVHEREDRNLPPPAHLEEFHRLGLDPLACIDDHHHGVNRRENAVRIFREILVAGRVQKIDAETVVRKLEYCRTDGNTPLPLKFHPVGRGLTLVLPGRHRPRKLHRAAIEEEFFREGGLPRVGVRDYRKRPSAPYVFLQTHELPAGNIESFNIRKTLVNENMLRRHN